MFPVYPGKRTPNCDCGVHLSKVDPSATSPARDSGPVQPRQHVRPRNRDDQNTDDQHEGDGEGRDVGMISRVVHDLLLRPVVGALPFTERFTSPALTSFIGDPGWISRLWAGFELHRLDVGPADDEVAFDHPHREGGHRGPWMGSPKCAPQRSQFEPSRLQPGATSWSSRSGIAQSPPCKAISSSRLYAAFQSHGH
jgi:hypothetical protein